MPHRRCSSRSAADTAARARSEPHAYRSRRGSRRCGGRARRLTATRRLIAVSALAAGLGLVGALLANTLLALIALSNNLFYFG